MDHHYQTLILNIGKKKGLINRNCDKKKLTVYDSDTKENQIK